MGGRGSSSLTSVQQGALRQIAYLQAKADAARSSVGVSKGQGINKFIGSSSKSMQAEKTIRNAENAIVDIRKKYGV